MRHLDAAYNLAHWLLGNRDDAEDAAQSAMVKALKSFDKLRGREPRPWLLAIVRNECMDMLRARKRFDSWSEEALVSAACPAPDPASVVIREFEAGAVRKAIDELPGPFREVILLREIEEMSYRDIAVVIDAPVGTVMSRLARARQKLQEMLS